MDGPGPDPRPDLFLFHHLRQLKALAASLREAPSRAAADALRDGLLLHAAIEERVCFPPLLPVPGSAAGEAVAASRKARSALLVKLKGPERDRGPELAARLEAYASLEQERLFPRLASLPGVTLREMALEIQELIGRRG
jgi:hypothetical protein